MSKIPYMPLFVDDFEAATPHLTFEEDGIYNRLLRLCWRTSGCSLPDDPVWIARRMRCEMNTYHACVEPIIREFFTRDKGRVYQKRLRLEWQVSIDLSAKRAASGRIGGLKTTALKTLENDASKAQAPTPPHPTPVEK